MLRRGYFEPRNLSSTTRTMNPPIQYAMDQILQHIQTLLVRDLESMKTEIEAFSTDDLIWESPPGVSNPAGTLAIHVCGNLNHYIGRVLGSSSYVRDRKNEFANRSLSRNRIYAEIDRTISMLNSILPTIDSSMLDIRYPERVGGFNLNTQQFLLHLCTHLSMHLGQAGYLRRLLTGENRSTGPASLTAINDGE